MTGNGRVNPQENARNTSNAQNAKSQENNSKTKKPPRVEKTFLTNPFGDVLDGERKRAQGTRVNLAWIVYGAALALMLPAILVGILSFYRSGGPILLGLNGLLIPVYHIAAYEGRKWIRKDNSAQHLDSGQKPGCTKAIQCAFEKCSGLEANKSTEESGNQIEESVQRVLKPSWWQLLLPLLPPLPTFKRVEAPGKPGTTFVVGVASGIVRCLFMHRSVLVFARA